MKKKLKNKAKADLLLENHVARHCNSQRLIRNPKSGEIEGVFPQAFELRTEVREAYVSLHRMEYFGEDVQTQYKGVVHALRNKGRTVSPKSAIARLCVGDVVKVGTSRNHRLRLRDKSNDFNPGYAGLEGMPIDNSDLGLLADIAACCMEVKAAAYIDSL